VTFRRHRTVYAQKLRNPPLSPRGKLRTRLPGSGATPLCYASTGSRGKGCHSGSEVCLKAADEGAKARVEALVAVGVGSNPAVAQPSCSPPGPVGSLQDGTAWTHLNGSDASAVDDHEPAAVPAAQ